MLTLSPDGETEALNAMSRLLSRAKWRDSEHASALRFQLAARLNAPERHLRFLAVTALPVVHRNQVDLASALAVRIDAEDDPDVLAAALSTLDQAVSPELADTILAAAATARTAGPTITELVMTDDDSDLSDLRDTWVVTHLNCALRAETPHTHATVRAWFSDPVKAGPLFRTAVIGLRSAFSFHTDDVPARKKAFDLIRIAAAALKPALIATPNDAEVALTADTLIEQLYFASGAFEGDTNSPLLTSEQKARWFNDVISILESLTSVKHPHSCYYLLETLEFLIHEDPSRVFRAIAATIKDDSDFRFESMGMDVAVRIIDRYLAEHRHLFLIEPQILSELRRILEVFAAVGWPAALHLSYSLGDIFR